MKCIIRILLIWISGYKDKSLIVMISAGKRVAIQTGGYFFLSNTFSYLTALTVSE